MNMGAESSLMTLLFKGKVLDEERKRTSLEKICSSVVLSDPVIFLEEEFPKSDQNKLHKISGLVEKKIEALPSLPPPLFFLRLSHGS